MMFSIRVILQFNQSFSRKLVVSHITLSMFDKFLVYVWSWCGGFERRSFYIGVFLNRNPPNMKNVI
jgi:hypothetical protein